MKSWRCNLIFFISFLLLSTGFSLLYAQSSNISDLNTSELSDEEVAELKTRLKLKSDCERYIEISKKADFTQKELEENIIIESGDESINCWTFVKNEEEKMKKDLQAKEKAEKKIYITVKDITEDLIEKESDQVSRLRDQLIFTGDKE
ncbi:MAG: hypothetical protein HQM13_02930 [SAR324 cluster bacterium]|nr:hypothetical protein [SAR324 cluster bacterium]